MSCESDGANVSLFIADLICSLDSRAEFLEHLLKLGELSTAGMTQNLPQKTALLNKLAAM